MKKWIIVLIVTITISGTAVSLDLSIGLKAGVSIPFFSGDSYKDWLSSLEYIYEYIYGDDFDFKTKLKIGFSGGAFITIGLLDFFALQPEIIITMAGGAYGYDETAYFYGLARYDNLNIIEIPILGVGRFNAGTTDINLFAGPNLCIRVGEVGIKVTSGGQTTKTEWVEDQFAHEFFSLVFGLGLTFYLHGGFLVSIDGRYNMSLTTVMNEDETGLDNWKQNNIQFMLGFGTIIKGKKAVRSRVR